MDNPTISVCCPSYKRPRCITSEYIHDVRIYVDPSEAEEYRQANAYGEVVACDDGIQGNLPRVRNYMLDKEFERADVVVMMDDDVRSLATFTPDPDSGFGYKTDKIKREDFYDFILYGSRLCDDWGFGMWGVNYNQDKTLYRQFLPFSTLAGAIGQFMVFTKDKLRFDEDLPLKEDYDMNIQQCREYGGVLMINWAHVNADFGKLKGGTSVRRKFDNEHAQFLRFREKWGSKIVHGVATTKVKAGGRGFVGGYDFSHPRVKIPIKGV